MLGDRAGNTSSVVGVSVADQRQAFDKWQQLGNGEPKGMKQRQRADHHIVILGIKHIGGLLNICHQVAVAQHDAFGLSFACAWKHNGSGGIGISTAAVKALKQPCR